MGKPDPPQPPNPQATAAAQTGTNVSTAIANAYLNNVNQNTPTGSLNYATTGNYAYTDPSTGQTFNIPQFTATQSMTPQGQAIQAQQLAAQQNLATMANNQSARISGLLSNSLDLSGAPSGGSATGILNVPQAATSYASSGPIQSSLDTSGLANSSNIQGSYGPAGGDLTGFTNQVQQAMMGQISPQLDVQKQQLEQQLADQGIRYGSDAYNNAMMPFNQQENNAYLQTVTGATGQAQTLMNMMNQQGTFANQAQQQAYQQALSTGGFANQAQNQQFQQNAAAGSFYNTGLAQQLQQQQTGFNAQQSQLNQWLQQQYAQRNQPINEITSLLSGSQVQSPNFINAPQSQIPTTDISGIMNQNFQNQMGIYNAQNQQYNTLVGGALGAGAGLLRSDVRTKENINRIGTIFAANDPDDAPGSIIGEKKLPVYRYSYKDDPASTMHVGPMAQDVEKIDPRAVKTIKGTKYIDQPRLMGSILRAA